MKYSTEQKGLIGWLTGNWLNDDAFKICVVQGFPGSGKTSIASEVSNVLVNKHSFKLAYTSVSDNEKFSPDDFFFQLSQDLSLAGITQLEDSINKFGNTRILNTLKKILTQEKVLIIIDEAQWALDKAGIPNHQLQVIFENISAMPLQGRILILTNQDVERGKWADRVEIKEYRGLNEAEALAYLEDLLKQTNVVIDENKKTKIDIVRTLAYNPRALSIFISRLRDEPLEDLIGRHLELWENGFRKFSIDLLQHLERDIIQSGFARLEGRDLQILEWLSILRMPFKQDAIIHFTKDYEEANNIRQKLRHLFFLEHQLSWYKLHPIVTQIARQKLYNKKPLLLTAHKQAATYYTRHFYKKNLGNSSRLGGNFVEARYHLTNANSSDVLTNITKLFGDYIHATIGLPTPVPVNKQELNERISMLISYIGDKKQYILEYHLARCLKKRAEDGDLDLAIKYALDAINIDGFPEAWILAAGIYVDRGDLVAAISLLLKGMQKVTPDSSVTSLYVMCAEVMFRNNQFDDAISLLKKGMIVIPAMYGVVDLYICCSKLMVKRGNVEDAVQQLREGLQVVPTEQNRLSIYWPYCDLIMRTNDLESAYEILGDGDLLTLLNSTKANGIKNSILNIFYKNNDVKGIKLFSQRVPIDINTKLCNFYLNLISGNYEKGLVFITEVKNVTGTNYNLYIWNLICCERYREASDAVDRHPEESPTSHWLRALIMLKLGNQEAANTAYSLLNKEGFIGVRESDLYSYWWKTRTEIIGTYPAFIFPYIPNVVTGFDKEISINNDGDYGYIRTNSVSGVDDDVKYEGVANVLCLATEWFSKNGGLSTFNRYLCKALANQNYNVVCVVPNSIQEEREHAASYGIDLIDAPSGYGIDNINRLQSRLTLPKGFIPHVIIGHDRITGPPMLDQQRSFFPYAKTIFFIHTAPEEIEWLKNVSEDETMAEKADVRLQIQKGVASKSDLVVAVGPKLYNETYMQLGAENADKIVRFDPGMLHEYQVPANVNLPISFCQIFGRMEDEQLKGVDIALKAMDNASPNFSPPKPLLIIRGLVKGTADKFTRDKRPTLKSGLQFRAREYDADLEKLSEDLKSSSLVLMPSRTEGFGLAGLEAISIGCPVLISSNSGLAELIIEFAPEEARHWVVSVEGDEANFINEWSKQIEFILKDRKASRERLKTLRTKLEEKISWDASVGKMMAKLNSEYVYTPSNPKDKTVQVEM